MSIAPISISVRVRRAAFHSVEPDSRHRGCHHLRIELLELSGPKKFLHQKVIDHHAQEPAS